MILVSPFPAASAGELHRWLNSPREPNFIDGAVSDVAAVTATLAAKNAAGQTFVALLAGEPVGFIAIAPASPVMAWFAGMVIAPEHRGKGIGAGFLGAVVHTLRAQGFRKLSAFFFADNDAIRATFASAGAVGEGYLKRAAMREGELVDMRLWSFNEPRGL